MPAPFIAVYLDDGTVQSTASCSGRAERVQMVRDFLEDADDTEELIFIDTTNLTWRSYAVWNPDDEEATDD